MSIVLHHSATRPQSAPLISGPALRAASVVGCVVLWSLCVWVSAHVRADPTLHTVALFGHLAALVVGFGAVLVIDYLGLLWLLGRRSLRQVLTSTDSLHLPVWTGLAGLMFTGLFLHPDLSSPLTCVKLVAVLVIALNGLFAGTVQQRLAALGGRRPPRRLLLTSAAAAGVSQLGWWLAVVVGFLNSQS
ncbi:hypothetical protein [Kitasatospora indigofera]|uniref:hypothetical protein n=1 Tax=Kitasatospora indigofera TaxID=67307 RepID=UPI0033B761A0